MPELHKSIALENGLQLSFIDQTNRYFGDFHRVCIVVRGEISLQDIGLTGEQLAGGTLADPLSFEKKLERMGVASADLEQTKQVLIDDFLQTAGSYLSKANFPAQLAKAKLAEKSAVRFQLRR